MATKANPWDADPVVSTGTNPWDADPVVASPAATATNGNPRLDRIKAYADETDKLLGLTPGTSLAQLTVESGLKETAVSPRGAKGLAQVMDDTRSTLEKRLKRKLDPFNSEDALVIHREVMRENIQKFGNREDALRAYNAGWDKNRWNNPETAAYVDKVNAKMGVAPSEGGTTSYKPFAEVRKNVDPATLYQDKNWVAAAALLYEMWERKPFKGEDKEIAEWGKTSMGNFNFNTVSMAEIAHAVSQGTQQQKEAFLYMLDTYDNTNWTLEGAGRAAKGIFTDPLNLVGIGTLGAGTVANLSARVAAKQAARALIVKSLARTGVTAGLEGALYSGVQSTIVQGVEVSAGRREEISGGKVALDALVGGTAGVVLGTSADLAASKIAGLVRRTPEGAPTVAPSPAAVAPTDTPAAAVTVPPADVEKPVLYRGQPSEFKDLQSVSNTDAIDNILIGRGVFTTTDKDLAKTYGPNIFEFEVPDQSRVFDLSNPGKDQLAKVMPEDFFTEKKLGFSKDSPTASGIRTYESLVASGKIKEAEDFLFESLVEKYLPDGVSWTEVKKGLTLSQGITPDGIRDKISQDLQAAGFDFVKHKGGLRAGGGTKVHDVYIALKDGALVETNKAGKVQAVGSSNPNLTPDEILAAKARQQDGRLSADEVVPDMTGAPAKSLVDVPEVNTGLRTTRVNGEEVAKVTKADVEAQATPLVEQLRNLSDADLPVALEQLRTGKFTLEEQRVISTATRLYADELAVATKEAIVARDALLAKATRTPEEDLKIQTLSQQIAALEARGSAQLTDDAFGSMAGTILNDRRLGSPSGVQTVDEIMAEKGVSREDAQKIWAEMVTQAEKDVEVQKVVAQYDQKSNQALAAGDLTESMKITAQKQREVAGMTEQVVPGSASLIAKMTELAISNVFSFGTVIINLIPSGLKTLVIPGLRAIFSNPFEKTTRVELSASYAAMRSSFGGALSAARTAYRYEQALLTRDGVRLVEGEMALTGKLGGALRVFPRILNASDEFLSRLNYDSFVAARAASEAYIEAAEKGLKGADLDKFVKEATDAALKDSRQAASGDELVQPIVNKGVNLGLTGDDLFKWVEKEILRNPDALKKGTDEEALNFVRDVLYKRKFSGEGTASKVAQAYEDAMQKFPSLKLLVGQLFFRTPIRVFEEGVRLTPGLQLIAPNFLDDLGGKNGTLRQVRAQAEAMTSLAVAGAVLSLYSQGRITGDGAYSDWKQQRTRTDGPLPEPYTIKLEDGSTWSYRNLDPIATPVKIMTNGLERMDRLRIREAQGEFIDKSLYDQAMAYVTVGTTAVAAAIRDANLVTGLNETIKVAENLADPERKEGAWLKFMGDKLFLLVPNTMHKIAKDNDPQIKDPQTFWQMVDEKLARPFGQNEKMIKTAYSYDPLGNTRKIADEGRIWTVFSTATVEERGKGISEEGQFVLAEMDRLSRVTGATFKAPTKHEMLGDFDLRTELSKDGKRTLYDVWQDNYRALNPDKILYPIAAAPVPDGTYKFKEGKATLMQEQIKALQDAAFNQLMADEERIIDKVISRELNKAKAGAGLLDSKRPY